MRGDVVELIMNDHREMERLFDELMSSPEKRAGLVPVMITLLTAHSRAEEAEVYPAAREAGGAEEVQHSQKEHLEADQLAARVAEMDPMSDDFGPALQELVDAVKHHVEEEEGTVLQGMRERMDDDRLRELGERFLASRREHLGDEPADITKPQLQQQAENADVDVPSSAGKEELKEKLAEEAES